MNFSLKGLKILISFPERHGFHNITGILADKFIDDKLGDVEQANPLFLKLRTKLMSISFDADSIECDIKNSGDNSKTFQQLSSILKLFFDKLGISTIQALTINYFSLIDITSQFKDTIHFMQGTFIKPETISEKLSDLLLVYEYPKNNFSVQSRLETLFDINNQKELRNIITIRSSTKEVAVTDILPKLQLAKTIHSYEISKIKKWITNKKETK